MLGQKLLGGEDDSGVDVEELELVELNAGGGKACGIDAADRQGIPDRRAGSVLVLGSIAEQGLCRCKATGLGELDSVGDERLALIALQRARQLDSRGVLIAVASIADEGLLLGVVEGNRQRSRVPVVGDDERDRLATSGALLGIAKLLVHNRLKRRLVLPAVIVHGSPPV